MSDIRFRFSMFVVCTVHHEVLTLLVQMCSQCHKLIHIASSMHNIVKIVVLHYSYPFSSDQDVVLPDWELYIKETASLIVQEQSPKRFSRVIYGSVAA